MAFEFKLPDIGEGVAEGEIVKWLVKEGDTIKEDDPLVEVMTDKATVEIPSPRAGTVLKLGAQEGDIVKVGSVLVVIAEREEKAAPAPPSAVAAAAADDGKARSPSVSKPVPPARTVLATPATRKLARELGLDISQIAGSGPGGRVTDEDVRRHGKAPLASTAAATPVTAPRAPSAVPTVAGPTASRVERIPLRGIRKIIAEHMRRAKQHAAHFTYIDEVDMTELVKLREEARTIAEKQGVKLTYLPFVIKAAVAALKEYPYLNGSIDEETNEIVLKKQYHVGMATATDAGLVVPVIKNADQKTIMQIGAEVESLAAKARDGKLTLEELQGGTFTITSLGAIGGLFATPIVNYPESAILGIHEIKKRPVVHDDKIVIREVMFMSLSFDHRLIDGHVGAQFAKTVKQYLEEPQLLLLTNL